MTNHRLTNHDWNELRERSEKIKEEQTAINEIIMGVTGGVMDSPIFTNGSTAYRFMWSWGRYHPEEVGRVENAKERFEKLKETVRGIQV